MVPGKAASGAYHGRWIEQNKWAGGLGGGVGDGSTGKMKLVTPTPQKWGGGKEKEEDAPLQPIPVPITIIPIRPIRAGGALLFIQRVDGVLASHKQARAAVFESPESYSML